MLTFNTLPATRSELIAWSWSDIQPLYEELAARSLTAETVEAWLRDWTLLCEVVEETEAWLFIATTTDIQDAQAQQHYRSFLEAIQPQTRAADQQLRLKLLKSQLRPAGFEVPLRVMQADVELFREANLPLLAQSGIWQGNTVNFSASRRLNGMVSKRLFHDLPRSTEVQTGMLGSEPGDWLPLLNKTAVTQFLAFGFRCWSFAAR